MRAKTFWTAILAALMFGAIAYGWGSGNMDDETSRKFEGSNELIIPAPAQTAPGLCHLPMKSSDCPEDTKGWEGSSEDNRVNR